MIDSGYVEHFYSNSLPIKYSWLLPDSWLDEAFSGSDYGKIQLRAQGVILPYCFGGRFTSQYCLPAEDINKLWTLYINFALERVSNLNFLEDLADIEGRTVDLPKLKQKVNLYVQK